MNRARLPLQLRLAAITAALLPLLAGPGQARDPICLNGGASVCGTQSTAARDSVTCPGATFAWDWATGYVSMDGAGGLSGCDTLTITGLPAGEPVALRVRLHCIADFGTTTSLPTHGFSYDLYFYGPHAGLGLDGVVNPGDPPLHLDVVQEMPLNCVAGVPIAMNLQFSGGGSGGVARFRVLREFLDLPEGASIVSRRGLTEPTPARVRTWGAVKTLWR